MKKIAVLISNVGLGSNLQSLIDAQKSEKINTQIVCVISDTPDAYGLVRAKTNKIKTEICPKKEKLLKILKKYDPDYICLAGWKQIITDDVIESFEERIINLHPGLIPDKLKGRVINPDGSNALWNRGLLAEKAINNFINKKATYAGSSVHFLTKDFDFGPVLERGFVKINKKDNVKSLYRRLKKKEHEIYRKALRKLTQDIKVKVMVVDGGGRGHALVESYLENPKVSAVFAVPGNDLMVQKRKKVKIFPMLKTTSVGEILKICIMEKIDLVDVCQDDAVAVGLVNTLVKNHINAFGPTKEAGQIEWDKAWSRSFMKKFKIPSPKYKICKVQKEGINFLKKQKNKSWYVKASGLASGKGALFAKNNFEAIEKIYEMKNFGKAGETYLLEEAVSGEEFSSFALVDGSNFKIIGHAQDHKTVYDSNQGPNTGGMGCSTSPLLITKQITKQIRSIFQKTVEGLAYVNRPYRGILYLGGIVNSKNKVYVIEFNARWGDPEAQVIVPSIKNDYYELTSDITKGNLKKTNIKLDHKYRVSVAVTAKGYPVDYSRVIGKRIFGLNKLLQKKDLKIYGAGIKKIGSNYKVTGGRLFYIVSQGKNVVEARKVVYNALSQIYIEGNNSHYRTDIGYKDLERFYKSND